MEVIKLEHMRDRPPRFAHLWKTADVGSVFRFSGALDGFGNPLASAQHWCRKYRPDLGVRHSVGVDGVLHVRFTKADPDGESVVRRGVGLTPLRSKAARIAAASASVTTTIG